MGYEPLSDSQWQQLESLFPRQEKRGRGKPHTPWRSVVNSILWVLSTGGKWDSLPKGGSYASKSAAHRWYREWEKNGLLNTILETYKRLVPQAETTHHPKRRNRQPKQKPTPEGHSHFGEPPASSQ